MTPEDDWIREGNAAFEKGDLDAALALYEKAEAGTTDPGLVAFNKAAVLYRLKRYREAELHYLRCVDDAPPARKAQALFSLGTTLLRQAEDKNIATLDRAIDAFAACLSQRDLSPQLANDAQYNLETARWLRFQAATSAKAPKNDESHEKNDGKKSSKDKHKNKGKDQTDEPGSKSDGGDDGKKDGTRPTEEQKPTLADKLGSGKLSTLPDTGTLVPQAPEDIAAHLEEVVARIREQRRNHQVHHRSSAPGHVKDW